MLFLLGVLVGGMFATVFMCLLVVSGRDDERE